MPTLAAVSLRPRAWISIAMCGSRNATATVSTISGSIDAAVGVFSSRDASADTTR